MTSTRPHPPGWIFFLGVVLVIGALIFPWTACAQEVAASEPSWVASVATKIYEAIPPAWWTFLGGLFPSAVAVVLFVEAVRLVVPALSRQPGVRLGTVARLVLGALSLVGGQATAFAGWVVAPGTGTLAIVLGGVSVWGLAVVGNEAIFKRIMATIHSRIGVAKQSRRANAKPGADVTP